MTFLWICAIIYIGSQGQILTKKYMRTDLYLGDLREDLREAMIRDWEKLIAYESDLSPHCKKLLNAIRTGQEIKIGEYINLGEEEIQD